MDDETSMAEDEGVAIPLPADAGNGTPKRFYRMCAVFLTVLTSILWLYLLSMEWVPQASFDILGILWLFTNLLKLFIGFIAVALTAATLGCWLRWMRLK